ncbi:MAG: hypothetical protein ACJAY6_002153, partial [Yoonia sp.]
SAEAKSPRSTAHTQLHKKRNKSLLNATPATSAPIAKRFSAWAVILGAILCVFRNQTLAAMQKIGNLGSKPQFAASATKVCYGWIGSRTNTIFLRPRSATYTKHIRLGSRLRRLRPPATNLKTILSTRYQPPSGGYSRWRFGAGSTLETTSPT